MRRLSIILFLLFATTLSYSQHDCPAYPKRGTFDPATFIKTEIPTDPTKATGIWLGQGEVYRHGNLNDLRRAFIPDNRPEHALAIAHAWNYHRNIVHRVEFPQIGYWLATIIQESEYMCDPGALWTDPNEAPPLYTTNNAAYMGRANTLQNGTSGTAGCYQIEGAAGSGWFQLGQNYPQGRFPQAQWYNLAGGAGTFVNAALVKSYYDVYTKEVYQNQRGWNIYESLDCTIDKYAYVKTSASGYNAGINAFANNESYFNGSHDGIANWTGLIAAGGAGDYPGDVASYVALLENDPGYPGYPANATFGGYYNEDISWAVMQGYLDQVATMYTEINFATDVTPLVQAEFIDVSGGLAIDIPFRDIGPVIDQIILALPREYPQIVEGSPMGINPTTCSGNKIPYAGLKILSGPTDITPGCIELCLGQSITLEIEVEGGGGPNPTYKWYRNDDPGTILSTELIYTVTPTTVGTYSYGVEVCNDDGCYKIGSNSENSCMDPRNANGFWVNTTDCSTCSFVASATKTNTPCKGMSGGSITLSLVNAPANYSVTYTANTPLGVVTNTFNASGNSVVIPNLSDGSYSFELEDLSDGACKAYTNTIVGYDTEINEYVDAEILGISNCVADLEANIVELPQPCTWKVVAYWPGFFQWDLQTLASIRTSTGLLSTDAYTRVAPAGEIDQWNSVQLYELEFELNTGDEIFFGTSLTTALGAQLGPLEFWLYDATDTEVFNITSPAGTAQPNQPPIEVGSYTVTCPYTPPSAYNFSWTPALANETSTSFTTNGEAAVQPSTDVTYVVTATNASNPICVLTDSVTIVQDPACVASCTPPTSITLSPTSATLCAGEDQSFSASISGTASDDEYYYSWYDNSGSAIAGKTGLTASTSGYDQLDLTNLQAGDAGTYTLRVEDGNGGNPSCYLEETFEVTVTAELTPTVVIEVDKSTICQGETVNFSITSSDIGSSPTYSWDASLLGTGQSSSNAWNNANGLSDGEGVTLSVSNIVGCYSSTTVQSNTINLTASPLPSGYSLTVPGSMCQSEQGVVITVGGGADANDFDWSMTNATLVSDTTGNNTTSITVDLSGSNPTFQVTPKNQCGTQTTIIDGPIVLGTIPSAVISTSGDDLEFCAGSAGVTLDAQNAGAGATYDWNGPASGSGISFATSTPGDYTVEVTLNGCTATSSTVTVVENSLPTATISGSASLCSDGSESGDLDLTLTGSGPWTIVMNDGVQDLSATVVSSSPIAYPTSVVGTYTITSVTDQNCVGTTSGSGTIATRALVDTSNYSVTCDINDDVIVSFDISGGTGAFLVNGSNTNITGSTFTSTPLPELTTHSFAIGDDSGCLTLQRDINKSCSCPATATVSGSTVKCNDGNPSNVTIDLTNGSDYSFDLLHNGVLVQSYSNETGPQIIYSAADSGTYSITNFTGTCPGSVNGTAVIEFYETPTATLSGSLLLCDDQSETGFLDLTLTGTPNWTIDLDDGNTNTAQLIITSSPYTVPISAAGNYTITSISDANCSGTSSGSGLVNYRPNIDTVNSSVTCDINDDAIITFDITDGSGGYAVTGVNGTLVGSTFTSDPLAENITHNLVIADDSACNPITVSFSKSCSCPETAVLSGGESICPEGNSDLTVALSGGAAHTFDLMLDNVFVSSHAGNSGSNVTINVQQEGTYTLSNFNGACPGSVVGSAVITHYTSPALVVSNSAEICDDGSEMGQIDLNFTGDGSWTYILNDGNADLPALMSNASPDVYNTSTVGTYTPVSLTDVHGCIGTVSGSSVVSHRANIDTSAYSVTCDPVTFDYVIEFDISGGTGVYQVTGIPGSVVGNHFTSSPLIELTDQSFVVGDGTSCHPLSNTVNVVCSCLATATISGGDRICNDGTTTPITLNFTGIGPYDFTLSDGTSESAYAGSSYSIDVSDAASYTIASFTDLGEGCDGSRSGMALVEHAPEPTAVLSGGGTICEDNDQTTVQIDFTGDQPWLIDYSDGINNLSQQVASSPLLIVSNSAATYNLISLSSVNGGCAGTVSGAAQVIESPIPTISINENDMTICAPYGSSVLTTTASAGDIVWYLDDVLVQNQTSPSLSLNDSDIHTGTFKAGISDQYCPEETSNEVVVDFNDIEVTASTSAASVELEESITLTAIGNGISYTWRNLITSETETGNPISPIQLVGGMIEYQVISTDGQCYDTTTISYWVTEPVVPHNIYTPNGDNVNETWAVDGLVTYPECIVRVYNRWGGLVYESLKGYAKPWDGTHNGKEMPVGTYYYIIELNDPAQSLPIKGFVEIMK